MAGKHYGSRLAFNEGATLRGQVYPGRLNKAFAEGWAQGAGANPYANDPASADFPVYQAWVEGVNAQALGNPPAGQPIGRIYETAP